MGSSSGIAHYLYNMKQRNKNTKVRITCEITGRRFDLVIPFKDGETDFAANWRANNIYNKMTSEEKQKIAKKFMSRDEVLTEVMSKIIDVKQGRSYETIILEGIVRCREQKMTEDKILETLRFEFTVGGFGQIDRNNRGYLHLLPMSEDKDIYDRICNQVVIVQENTPTFTA